MSNGKRRYFPGANTGRGFIGHFEGIVLPSKNFAAQATPKALTPCVSRSGGSSYWTAPRRTP